MEENKMSLKDFKAISDNSANGRQQLDAESASTELDLISEDADK
jgi:hypothetical protein